LEDIQWEPVNKRDTKYGSYEEMLTTEGSPSEDDESWLEHVGDKDYKHYYAFDDDFVRGRRVSYNGINPDSSDDTPPSKCRRTAQHRLMFPTCNEVHQIDYALGSTYSSGFRFVNHGTFRDVFGMVLGKKPVAIKEIRYQQVDADHELFEYVRVDALVAERLSKHPRSFELYSYCGLTVISEFFFHGDIERQAFWESSDSSDSAIVPDQKTTPDQKLVLSLEMAQGLALLHGNPDGMIIHGDVQMSQFLLSKDKTMLKLNDFNRAEILLWDETHNEYCQHRNGVGRGRICPNIEYGTRILSRSHLIPFFHRYLESTRGIPE
jgi:serine/threonine protein kinase